ncbi:MAG: LysE family transporter [Clostridium sp.]|uniref:LysE family transporter n=1 Tax=Clostridium sp. TaxID=1506 RepID=UPI0025BBF7B3|nr:LysE family transporter [Clostridium sp.]MCH3963392.1 LysE family transporter [Clostridium sp.]MCI1716740.1 LysE family transporter [Clostridium sp.]MCI1801076.1 LysE family transporter [Clostridium sp.]MCI1814926.1 LysE family transporter [Clostridium sp.]MCI1871827.1 LysE family transporter [Clostridium sp.]
MSLAVFWTMLIYMLICSFTPGPGNILALNTTTHFGWQRGKRLIFGICAGYACVQILCTLAIYGLNTFLTPALHILKYIGSIYMVWLAVHILSSKPLKNGENEQASFRDGFSLQFVNVKIYFYIITLLMSYLVPYISTLYVLLLAGIGVVAVGGTACLTWALLGIKMQRIYEEHYKFINSILSLFLLYCAWDIARG